MKTFRSAPCLSDIMYLILGLGNPGKEYHNTRHNVGYMALEKLAEDLKIDLSREKFQSVYGEGRIGSEKVILAKPLTYMNLSGQAARAICDFYRIDPEHVIVLYDDMNLSVGSIRIRAKGSDGGHNGIKSLIYHLISDQFPRVRFGVGAPHGKGDAVIRHVLGRLSDSDAPLLDEAISETPEIVKTMITRGVSEAMNRFNRTVKPEETDHSEEK